MKATMQIPDEMYREVKAVGVNGHGEICWQWLRAAGQRVGARGAWRDRGDDVEDGEGRRTRHVW